MGGLLLGFIVAAGSSLASDQKVAITWQAQQLVDHPLVGTIWSATEEDRLTPSQYKEVLTEADAVILGEIHDNPDHHVLQAQALQAIVRSGKKPAVIFEMITTDLQVAVDDYVLRGDAKAQGFGEAVRWEQRGWPSWSTYQPIAEVAFTHSLPILAGDLPRDLIRAIGMGETVPGALRERLQLDTPLSDASQSAMLDTLFKGHCDLLPRQKLAPMQASQVARDASLGVALADGMKKHGAAVLIAGSGHGRNDYASPYHLSAKMPDADVLSIAFVEVAEGAENPQHYLPESTSSEPVYDILVFTPRAERDDPCEALRARFGKTKAKPASENEEG